MALHPKRKNREGVDEYGRTPLINAVIDSDLNLINDEIANGCNINLQDDGGYSALFFAVQNKNIEITTYLLSNNADANLQDKYGQTPLLRALNETLGNPDVDAEIMEILLQHGATITPPIKHYASQYVCGEYIRGGTMSPKLSSIIAKLAEFKA